MRDISPVCYDLVTANLSRLPKDYVFRGNQPSYEAVQEVFWAAMVAVLDELLAGPPHPDEIHIGKQLIPITVTPAQWHHLLGELGLDDARVRTLARVVLSNHLLLREGQRRVRQDQSGTLAECFSLKLLGLVLLTCYLDLLGRNVSPESFAYEFRELTYLARGELAWAQVGSFDEGQVARAFFTHAAIRLQRSDRLLWKPYHAYYRPLSGRLVGRTPLNLVSEATTVCLPTDYLLRTLPEIARREEPEHQLAREHTSGEAPSESWRRVLQDELKRLRAENDRLQHLAAPHLLVRLLAPVLSTAEQPLGAIEQAIGSTSLLAKDVLQAMATLLRSPEIEVFGDPTQEVELTLPHATYGLDDAVPPARRDISRGRFRVKRRGIRFRGILLLPATVVPIQASKQ